MKCLQGTQRKKADCEQLKAELEQKIEARRQQQVWIARTLVTARCPQHSG